MNEVAIIIPTFNNNEYLFPCLKSILSRLTPESGVHVYVVNNGDAKNLKGIVDRYLTVLQQERNLGWEGGLRAGLTASTEEFVIFMNDDTLVPPSSIDWIDEMLLQFLDPKVAAVGPSSNCVMGVQNIFVDPPFLSTSVDSNFLIGYCMMVRRSALDEVGGIDDSLPGGDDLDLSIRFRKAGYSLVADRSVFVYHHGFKTGERVKGGPNIVGGWNSVAMMEKTNFALMVKHGLRSWIGCMNQVIGPHTGGSSIELRSA